MSSECQVDTHMQAQLPWPVPLIVAISLVAFVVVAANEASPHMRVHACKKAHRKKK
jgi:hypothetical protein